jgi:hypothetical protein
MGEKAWGARSGGLGRSMRLFLNYPIIINYNLHTQLRSGPHENLLHKAKQYREERRLFMEASTTSDIRLENRMYKPEIDQYESAVLNCLKSIHSNPVGRMVLGKINKQTTVWIIPKTPADMKQCTTCAQTGPLKYEFPKDESYARGLGYGNTVIRFAPELGDDTLIHELTHAYRYSYRKFNPIEMNVRNGKLSDTQSSEEFFAHQMETIYMSQAGRPLTMDYKWASVCDKKKIYDFLVENSEMLQTLKFFIRHECLARLAAQSFATDYNPFRDYLDLEARFLNNNPSLSQLPELT